MIDGNVTWNHTSGWPSELANLRHRVSGYLRGAQHFKVGITNNPIRRAKQHDKWGNEYDEMVVIYWTTSKKHIKELERSVIADYPGSDNACGGGGGAQSGPYYLYVNRKF